MTKLDELRDAFQGFEYCGLEKLWTPDEVEEVLLFTGSEVDWYSVDSYPWDNEGESIAVVRLKTGEYGLLESSSDYTGHGCQCSEYTNRYDDLETLLVMGIEENIREKIRALLEEPVTEPEPEPTTTLPDDYMSNNDGPWQVSTTGDPDGPWKGSTT